MVTIAGYRLAEELYNSSKTLVYRAWRETDSSSVIIKLLKNPYPSFSELAQFRNHYTITKNLNYQGIIQNYSLEPYQNGYVLVMEDFGGIPLQDYFAGDRQQDISFLQEFLQIAIALCNCLQILYQERIIHKDIKPSNILINPATKEIKLIDFSIASLLPRETQTLVNPNLLEGTLAYISPEQTGRMNRLIDYRTDFYSLGVTFYQLLTGELPFPCQDAMELVHCHIAKQPNKFDSEQIPSVLSDIVMKLMAKNAEYRYQSALGLKYDLENCLTELQAIGEIKTFPIGQQDVCDRFIIPEKLYGREQEVQTLLQAFERVADGATEIILVAGFSGIGKTMLVNEVHKPIVQQRGYFIKGKFDQFNRNIPFSAFVQAFRDLMRQLLAESDEDIQQWKSKILQALGEDAQVIIDVIPELLSIIGQQKPATELTGTALENRFNLLFQKFVQVFTTKEHPLVIFLDDLQWADVASFKLIQLLISENNRGYLLLIGAYRDNEVSPVHPLMLTLKAISEIKQAVKTITLLPLNQEQLNQLVADTLKFPDNLTLSLSQLIYRRTAGNPFFTNQLLQSLYQEGLIVFNWQDKCWQYNISHIHQQAVTSNVVEFMVLQLQRLPKPTQTILKLAACIGNDFDLQTLVIICELTAVELATNLWPALQADLIVVQGEFYQFYQGENQDKSNLENTNYHQELVKYRFLHDRVQQAAYCLISEDERKSTHLKIGQLLLANFSNAEWEEHIFTILNQLNIGRSLLNQDAVINQLLELNFTAARKAKLSTAYGAATEHITICIELLAEDSWQSQTHITKAIYELAVEVAYLSTNYQRMEELAAIFLAHTDSLIEKVRVYEIKMLAARAQAEFLAAIEIGLQLLELLGIEFPTQPTPEDIGQALQKTLQLWQGREIYSLLDAPIMADALKQVAMQILSQMVPSAYQAFPQLMPLLIFKQIELSIVEGNCQISPFSYAEYGLVLCGIVGDLDAGYQFGQLALKLIDRLQLKTGKCRAYFIVHTYTSHWKQSLSSLLPLFAEGYQAGLESGDLESSALNAGVYSTYSYFAGCELSALAVEMEHYRQAILQLKQVSSLNYHEIYHQTVLNLLGLADNPCELIGEVYDEVRSLPLLQQANNWTGIYYLYYNKTVLCYLFENYQQAAEYANLLESYINSIVAMYGIPLSCFYNSLIHLALFVSLSPTEQTQVLEKVAINQKKLQHWADNAPMNYLHKFHLVEAEKYRVLGNKAEAIEYYDRAISGAKENGYIQEQALANELAAKFYLDWGKEKIAAVYMQEAYYCYGKWGAKAKINHLEKVYRQLLQPILQQQPIKLTSGETISLVGISTVETSTGDNTNIGDALDFTSALKAAQAISSSLELDTLISSLTRIILENSGAEKSVLILPAADTWQVRAITFINDQKIETRLQSQQIIGCKDIPEKIINYVKNTQQIVVIDDCLTDIPGILGEYMQQIQPKSVLCTPIIHQGHLVGILYLENQLTTGVFNSDRLQVIQMLSAQAAISLENARLYQESQEKAQQLQQYLQQQQTLFKVVTQIREALNLEAIFSAVTQNMRQILNADRVGIYQFHLDVNYEYGEFIAEDVKPQFSSALAVKIQDRCFGENFANLYKKGRICAIDDVNTDAVKDCHREILAQFQVKASLVVPIMQDKELWGLLCIHQCDRPRQWQPFEIQFAQQVGAQMGVALKQTDLLMATQKQATQLEQTLQQLQQTQLQLVQNEKMSMLGNLVAGVAHEMNNPLGFIYASLQQVKPTLADITEHLQLYQVALANPGAEILDHAEQIDLDFSLEDLPKIIDSMALACDRLRNISTSLRVFSRADQEYKVPFNLHEGIDSTILILKHRLKANQHRPAIEVITNYGDLPLVNCFPGQLNQVFMNMLANAIDALDEVNIGRSFTEVQANPNRISITTSVVDEWVKISIADNGKGMSEAIKEKIFDHLFTTKPVGKGTGLGLAIARQIIVEKHGGIIEVNSQLGAGTEFIIQLPL